MTTTVEQAVLVTAEVTAHGSVTILLSFWSASPNSSHFLSCFLRIFFCNIFFLHTRNCTIFLHFVVEPLGSETFFFFLVLNFLCFFHFSEQHSTLKLARFAQKISELVMPNFPFSSDVLCPSLILILVTFCFFRAQFSVTRSCCQPSFFLLFLYSQHLYAFLVRHFFSHLLCEYS